MPQKLFGTNGIRGPADTLFTRQFCLKIGYVFGTWLNGRGKQGYVAVGMDPRESSPRIKDHLCQGLALAGWEILDQGVVPTPALTYFVKQSPHVGGGVMVTGSHITAHLNGVKLFINGEEVTKEDEPQIESLFSQTHLPETSATAVVRAEDEARQMYIDMLVGLADLPYPKWKIVVDVASGTQTQIMRELFKRLGLTMDCLGECDIQSPHFTPRDTETESAFVDLIRQVVKTQADFGVGFDVDGDRVIFIDDQGRYLPGDYSCSLIARESTSAVIVTPINTSSVVESLGKTVHRTQVGATYVIAKMKATGALFGFEANGGGISAEIFYGRDGASTLVKMLNLLKKKSAQLSVLYDQLPHFYLFRDKVDCPMDRYDQIYHLAQQRYSGRTIDQLDGVKVHLNQDEWVLFRGSGNAPEFRIFVQSLDQKRVESLGHTELNWVRTQLMGQTDHAAPDEAKDTLHIWDSVMTFADQCQQVITEMSQQTIPAACSLADNIVVTGMGGSALGGRIIASLEREALRIPIVVSTEYHLPAFVNQKTLVVISSYSGDTEETLACFNEAVARQAQIFVITSGGRLAKLADKHHLPSYIFTPQLNPSNQPRMGLGYNIMTVLTLLARCQLVTGFSDLNRLPQFLKSRLDLANTWQKLAAVIRDKIPVLVASDHLKGAAHAVKNLINENGKTFALTFDLPEANHHLLEGLGHPPAVRHLAFLWLDSAKYHPEVHKRYAITARVVSKMGLTHLPFPVAGESTLAEVLDVVQSGAMLSYYLSQEYRVDPGPIPWVDFFKDEIRQVV